MDSFLQFSQIFKKGLKNIFSYSSFLVVLDENVYLPKKSVTLQCRGSGGRQPPGRWRTFNFRKWQIYYQNNPRLKIF